MNLVAANIRQRGSRWRSAALIVAAVAVVALAYPTAALSEEFVPPEYATVVWCEGAPTPDSSHTCRRGDPIGASFTSWRRSVVYEVCVTFSTGRKVCTPNQLAQQAVGHIINIPSNIEGLATVAWFVEGRQVGTWEFNILHKPIVPKFGVSPLIVAGTHRLFGLQVRHVPDGLRVRAWRQCPKRCELKLRLISRRNEVRSYKIVGPPDDSTFSFGEMLYVQVDAPGEIDHGDGVWGRVYKGELVRDPSGGPQDTAIHRIGKLLCTHPNRIYRAAIDCGL